MHHTTVALIELGAIFFGLGVLGRLAWKIGISPSLLLLGLEYSAAELVTGVRRSWLAGVVDLLLNAARVGEPRPWWDRARSLLRSIS